MVKYLTKKYQKITVNKQYIIAEGELPVCLVAHLDTVEQKPPTDIYYDREECVAWSPQLLGADDRAGVYAIIQLVEMGYRPHIILTKDEEQGAIGARALVTQKPDCPLENLKAIFQLDRRGSDDCVFYDCDNPDFTKYVESFGFKEAYGSFSDISVIAPAWGVAAANLSVGYYLEHSNEEYLKCNELENTIEKVANILKNASNMLSYSYIPAKLLYFINSQTCICCNKNKVSSYNFQAQNYFMCDDCFNSYWVK